ncbi:MAG TPA: nucleotidyl transferase AbiEii/AbiGii toxin family protein [Mycobacteriales bacterium]|nr:nucleotidyl transferase AbiEii/AbiGii toxin family protein [Mycobacteriales bacterium]
MTADRPTRATIEGRAYLDLQNLARRDRRPTDELHQLYALEGFLARLAGSPYADALVLKGGVLMAAYDARRPTRDVDMQARAIAGSRDDVLRLVRETAAAPLGDGLLFDTQGATAEIIRDEDEYSGVRITLTATLAAAKLSLHVDVSVGDPIWPAPRTVELPRLLGGPPIIVAGYPLPMVYAEKIVTALQRGTVNTRWRDFADLYILTGRHPAEGPEVHSALSEVASYRKVELSSLEQALTGYAAIAQSRWSAWRRKQRLDDRLPAAFGEVLDEVVNFADPALTDGVSGLRWYPGARSWA